jgi:hypothetical protein
MSQEHYREKMATMQLFLSEKVAWLPFFHESKELSRQG